MSRRLLSLVPYLVLAAPVVGLPAACASDAQAARTVAATIPEPPAAESGNSRTLVGRDFTLYALDDTARRITCYVRRPEEVGRVPASCAAWPDRGRGLP